MKSHLLDSRPLPHSGRCSSFPRMKHSIGRSVSSRKYLAIGVAFAAGLLFCGSAGATLIWDGDANIGISVFQFSNIENNPGVLDVITDSTYGKVFRMICYDNGSTKVRAE